MQRLADLKLLLVLALVLRLALLLLAGVNAPLTGDELAFQQIAVNVAAGRGFVQNNNPFFPGQLLYAWQAPLYPLSLAAVYLLFGTDPIIGKLFGVLLGVATVYLTFDLARRVFPNSPDGHETRPSSGPLGCEQDLRLHRRGRAGAAWLAALFVAIYPGLLTNAHLLLSETLFTFLLVLSFDLIAAAIPHLPFLTTLVPSPPSASKEDPGPLPVVERDPSPPRPAEGDPSPPRPAEGDPSLPPLLKGGRGGVLLIAAAGAAWGAATLTRGITLYFVVPLALWLAIRWVPSRQFKWRQRVRSPLAFNLRMAIVFAAATAVVMVPWAMRNMTVFHQFVLLETKGGVNFWLGNSPYTPDDFIRNVWKTGVREPMLAALPLGELARDRAGYALGEAYVVREPLTFIARMPVKFADFWGFERNLVDAAQATHNGTGGWNSPSKIAADFVSDAAYVLLVLLAAGGLVFAREDRWKLLFGGFIAYFVFVHLVVFGDGRFHLPLIPFLALYAAWFVANRGDGVRAWTARGVTALGIGLVFAAVWGHEIIAAWSALRGGL
jgi:4-amino-4-deoxy-L-arabinose transferase-like glycosyltransferase